MNSEYFSSWWNPAVTTGELNINTKTGRHALVLLNVVVNRKKNQINNQKYVQCNMFNYKNKSPHIESLRQMYTIYSQIELQIFSIYSASFSKYKLFFIMYQAAAKPR